jgi:tRNA (mo5U34)-methyltransferase
LAPGVVTPGHFDLRPVVEKLPWPDITGNRCLDVATYDGFFAFEMERRGASSVLATDIRSHEDWDWPPAIRSKGPDQLAKLAGEKGFGFEIAKEYLDSAVEKQVISVYDLEPGTVGMFDFVFCGSLLLHLRDPLRALESIRSVCRGFFLSSEQIDAELTLMHPRKPITCLSGVSRLQWHVPNRAGHRLMLRASGFEVVQTVRPFSVPFGPAHVMRKEKASLRRRLVRYAVTRSGGVPHSACLVRA